MRFVRSILLALLATAGCFAADVTGKWVAEVPTNDGNIKLTMNFKAEGDVLTGTVTSHMGETPIKEGKIAENELTWILQVEVDGAPLKVTNKATITGDEMKITTTMVGRDRSFQYTAKKAS
jgi:hypothetical protein